MKIKTRTSATKHRRKTGFLTRKKSRGGREVLREQRRVAAGRPKRAKLMRQRHIRRKARVKAQKN